MIASRLFPSGIVFLLLIFPAQIRADWPQFRGPGGAGVAEGQHPPVRFTGEQNVLWKSAIPGGPSSPCIVGERIFLTAWVDEKLETLCINRLDGTIRWRRVAPADRLEAFHPREGSPASATPVSDGKLVIVYFASYGLLAYDLEGKVLWRHTMPIPRQMGDFGSGCSPILESGLVLLNRDQMEGSHLLAVSADDGELVWRAERPEFVSSFGTPVIWNHRDRKEVVLPGSTQMRGYDLKTGAEHWKVSGLPTGVCTSPVVSNELLYFAGWSPGKNDSPMPPFSSIAAQLDQDQDGHISIDEADEQMKSFFNSYDLNRDKKITGEEWQYLLDMLARGNNVAMAVRPGGQGDITDTHVVWKYSRGLPYVSSPLVYRGRIYFVKDGGMLTCLEAATGRVHYAQERLGAMGSYYASPVAAAGRIYCTSLNGMITVVRAGDSFDVIAQNDLDERIAATPAIVGNRLYVRTQNHLYAFAE